MFGIAGLILFRLYYGGPFICEKLDLADEAYDNGEYQKAQTLYGEAIRQYSHESPRWKYTIEQIKSCQYHIEDRVDSRTRQPSDTTSN